LRSECLKIAGPKPHRRSSQRSPDSLAKFEEQGEGKKNRERTGKKTEERRKERKRRERQSNEGRKSKERRKGEKGLFPTQVQCRSIRSLRPVEASATPGDLTCLEGFLTLKWLGSFTALAPPLPCIIL